MWNKLRYLILNRNKPKKVKLEVIYIGPEQWSQMKRNEIITRLDNPYPDADEGYAPLPLSDHEKVRAMLNVYPAKPDSGLLTDD